MSCYVNEDVNKTIYLRYNNFYFEADYMRQYLGNQSVSKLQYVKNAFRIHKHTLT